MDLLAALQDSAFAEAVRSEVWIYPLVNTAHIIGIALLVGAIAMVDLKLVGLIGIGPGEEPGSGLPLAVAGLLIAVTAGLVLFSTRPLKYAADPIFQAKLGLIALALANAVAIRIAPGWRAAIRGEGSIAPRIRVQAALSILLWIAVVAMGRMIGYFGLA